MLNRRLDRNHLSRGARVGALAALRRRRTGGDVPPLGADAPMPLSGTVYDTTGAVLPQVELILEDAQAARLQVVSDSAGRFEFAAVAPGRYALETSLLGFKPLRYQFDLRQPRDWSAPSRSRSARSKNITITAARPVGAPPASEPARRGRQHPGAAEARGREADLPRVDAGTRTGSARHARSGDRRRWQRAVSTRPARRSIPTSPTPRWTRCGSGDSVRRS